MAHIKLHAQNLRANLELLGKKAGGIEKITAVLKDNAYGHGLELFARQVAHFGVKHAITRDAKEALSIEQNFQDIIALSEYPENFFAHPKIIFAANELQALKIAPKATQIALKTDSGMHRNGIAADELEAALSIIKERGLKLHSIFTHFRAADEIGGDFFWQKANFDEIKKAYENLRSRFGLDRVFFHSHNSAALLRCGKFDEDFARVGIAMYGYCDLPKAFGDFPLKTVLELCARKMSTRALKTGDRVGYGGAYEAEGKIISSVYDAGYADGVFRYDGRGDLKTAEGKRILGRVSMDSMSVEGGAEVISVFTDAEIWAKAFNTISYDILVKLSPKLPREFV